MRMQYKPKGYEATEAIQLIRCRKRAQMFYEYEGEVVWYSIYMNAEDSSLGQKESDENLLMNLQLKIIEKRIEVTEIPRKRI